MNKAAKKKLYVGLFVFLGLEIFFLASALFGSLYIGFLNMDFCKYGFGLTWQQLELAGRIGAAGLLAIGAGCGFFQGKYWWREIYETDGGENFFKRRRLFFKTKK
jgi:hypothetical protein